MNAWVSGLETLLPPNSLSLSSSHTQVHLCSPSQLPTLFSTNSLAASLQLRVSPEACSALSPRVWGAQCFLVTRLPCPIMLLTTGVLQALSFHPSYILVAAPFPGAPWLSISPRYWDTQTLMSTYACAGTHSVSLLTPLVVPFVPSCLS